MIINEETGDIISQGTKLNSRHLWAATSVNEYVCQKCDCIKIELNSRTHECSYILDGMILKAAPACDNRNLTIIENEKKIKRNDEQLAFKF